MSKREHKAIPSEQAPDATASEPKQVVKKHLQCPACYTGRGGVAARRKWSRQVSGTLQKRCYACDKCDCEWTVDVRYEVIDDIEHVTTKVSQVRNP